MHLTLFDFFKDKKVLITGHTGFKGSWLTKALLMSGAQIIGVSIDPPSHPNLFSILKLKNQIKHNFTDVRDYNNVLKIFNREKPEIVFHLAAQPIVFESYKDPIYTYQTNIMGTVNILEALRNTNSVKSAVFITTDKVYKVKNKIVRAHRESDELGGVGPYSTSKVAAELIIQSYINSFFRSESYRKEHNTLIASARSGNVIGGGDWGEYRLITDIVRTIFEHKGLNIRNKNAIRPWIYILEVLEAYLLLSKKLFEGNTRYVGPWNFSPDLKDQVTVKEMVDIAFNILNVGDINVSFNQVSQHEVSNLTLDSTKARNLLGWKPKYNVKERLIETFKWYEVYYTHPKKIIKYTEECIAKFWG